MMVLGINAYHGDVSAALLRDGELVAAVEEERFRRVKHWAGFPTHSIRSCLEMAGVTGADVDHVAISRDPLANLWRKVAFTLSRRPDPRHVLSRLRNQRKVRAVAGPLSEALGISGSDLPPIHKVEHHPSHLASAFFASPFETAAVAAIDGFGDFVSTSLAHGDGNRINVLERVFFPHSLGILYTAVTQYLGFRAFGDEFKVMGLAPYGLPNRVKELRRLIELKPGGRFELDLRYFRHWSGGVDMEWEEGYPSLGIVYTTELERLLGPPRRPDEPLTQEHEDLARSLQAVHEESVFHVLNGLWERTRLPSLALAGGSAMNSVANGKTRDQTPFEEVFIQPAAADNGTALGAALHVWNQVLGNPRRLVMRHGYWGPEYGPSEIARAVAAMVPKHGYVVEQFEGPDETVARTARLIADGNVVGWYQGRMEWGARALGNRSILADPRRADMRDLINTKIKFREKFRPFAPSVAEEAIGEYFVGAVPDPFMIQVYPIRPEKRQEIPAVTHVDGSGRLQTVSSDTNPLYHRLIREFAGITGVPIVLNTSFNENEPIVDTPSQALDCFLRTRMDAIVLGNTMVRRLGNGADPDGGK